MHLITPSYRLVGRRALGWEAMISDRTFRTSSLDLTRSLVHGRVSQHRERETASSFDSLRTLELVHPCGIFVFPSSRLELFPAERSVRLRPPQEPLVVVPRFPDEVVPASRVSGTDVSSGTTTKCAPSRGNDEDKSATCMCSTALLLFVFQNIWVVMIVSKDAFVLWSRLVVAHVLCGYV